MEASKENCKEAQRRLLALLGELGIEERESPDADYLMRFLEAAGKRLPAQASIEKDRRRRHAQR